MNTEQSAASARKYLALAEGMPIPEEIDWGDSPTQFKVYRDKPRIPLGYRTTPTAEASPTDRLGQLLLDCYGVTRYRWTTADALRRLIGTRGAEPGGGAKLARNALRPVPSGGSRFPAELYVVAGPGSGAPPGVYHYDAAHHSLVTLRDGDWTPELAAGLGGERSELTLLTTAFFWKNAFKYGDVTYRLCGLDIGVLIGQILAVAAREQTEARVRYQFADDTLDGLLRLDPMRESVYAAIALGPVERTSGGSRPVTGAERPRTGSGSVAERDWSIATLPLQAEVHQASRRAASPPEAGAKPEISASGVPGGGTVALPGRRVDPLGGLRARRSSMGYFTPSDLGQDALAALLAAAAEGYRNDLDGPSPAVRHTALLCAVNRVSGLEPGVYRYRPERADLELVRAAPGIGGELQEALLIKLFNLTHTNLCIYPVGEYESGFRAHGDRWYRMQNMEAGILTQRLYLAAAALGLRCHASLGYHVPQTNRLLGIDGTGLTSLLQVMIGSGRAPGDFYEAGWH
ncbi:SagB-type dehydrogenase domain-containing protein [Saccharopolyspora shandongensis]|uniref:SagB-type dehydrogenase domain-containing protein n=1 Tax=Saccharopolyspora shandongensis TaxID=418495 RepID=A0A1H3M4Z8_9PSEU|nr:SagB family peptide dehydrogenase [Saccharopolyspora shandongensis]SDY71279.1 SagB-type dehydrogenase domain-containing protein [Saccharopolyspora shandongensis]